MGGLAAASPNPKHKGGNKHSTKSQVIERKTPVWQNSAGNDSISAIGRKPADSGMSHCLNGASSDSASTDQNRKPGMAEYINQSVNSVVSNIEYDSVSTNGSCSGESEDQPQVLIKEKSRNEPPGLVGPCDKREKSRVRNGKKHQRQKERRAKELRDRSISMIMSHKLKVLTEQLVGMGFASKHAEMALILSNGHVENSIACLLEGIELLEKACSSQTELKLDISEELRRIANFEADCNAYSRSDIDKVVVACEGDVEKAVESLHDLHLHKGPIGHADFSSQTVKHDETDDLEEQIQPALSFTVSNSPAHLKERGKPQTQTKASEEEAVTVAEKSRGQHIASLPKMPSESISETYSFVRSALGNSNFKKNMVSWDGREIAEGFPNCVSIPQRTTASFSPSQLLTGCNSLESGGSFWSSLQDVVLQGSGGQRMTQQSLHKPDAIHSQVGINYMTDCLIPFQGPFQSSASSANSHLCRESDKNVGDRGGIGGKAADYNQNVERITAQSNWPSYLTHTSAAGRTLSTNMLDAFELPICSPSFPCTSSMSQSRTDISSDLWTGWGSGAPVDWNLQSVRNRDYQNVDWSMSAAPVLAETPFSANGSPSQMMSSNPILDQASPNMGLTDHSASNIPRPVAMTDAYNLWGSSKFSDTCTKIGTVGDSTHDIGNSLPSRVEEWTSPFAGKDLFTLPRRAVLSTL